VKARTFDAPSPALARASLYFSPFSLLASQIPCLPSQWGASNAAAFLAGAAKTGTPVPSPPSSAPSLTGVHRILCSDPADAIIHWRGALLSAVATRVVLPAACSGSGAPDSPDTIHSIALQLYFSVLKLALLCAPTFVVVKVGGREREGGRKEGREWVSRTPLHPVGSLLAFHLLPDMTILLMQRSASGENEAEVKPLPGRPLPAAAVAALSLQRQQPAPFGGSDAAGGPQAAAPTQGGVGHAPAVIQQLKSRLRRFDAAATTSTEGAEDGDVEGGSPPPPFQAPPTSASNPSGLGGIGAAAPVPVDPRDAAATAAFLSRRFGGASLPLGSIAERAAQEWALGRLSPELLTLATSVAAAAGVTASILERSALHDAARHWQQQLGGGTAAVTAATLARAAAAGLGRLHPSSPPPSLSHGALAPARGYLGSADADSPLPGVEMLSPTTAGLADLGNEVRGG
jgi:hypothetical protein